MVATNDALFVATANHVYAISLQTHQIVWTYDIRATRLALGDNKLFIVTTDDEPRGNAKATLIAIALK